MTSQPSFVSQPSIQRIPVLLRELLDGELLIPRFQRPSIWSAEQQLLLLDSIRRNYPIGSILVWRTRTHVLASFESVGGLVVGRRESGMPEYKQYVLDGHQRLSTLLRMLGPGLVTSRSSQEDDLASLESEDDDDESGDLGEVFFDLDGSQFVRPKRSDERAKDRWVPVSILLDPYKLDPFKVELAKRYGKDGRRLGQIADDLAVSFKDYTLPVTPLASEDLEFVTESFRRVNSAGSPMSEVHMVHALSWTGELDLVSQLEEVKRRFTEFGWEGISSEAMLTTCKVILELDPARAHPDELKRCIRADAQLLPQVERCLKAAADFLLTMKVRSLGVLPYEYQIVGLAFVASRCNDQLPAKLHAGLSRWFWYVTYTAYLFNTPSLRKVIDQIRSASPDEGAPIPMDADLRVMPIRRINFHNARTRAFALRLAWASPQAPNGSEQDAGELLAIHGGNALVPLLPKRLAKRRTTAPENRVLLDPKVADQMRIRCLGQDAPRQEGGKKAAAHFLASHLITDAAFKALREQRYDDFLDLRRAEIDRVEGDFVRSLDLQFGTRK